jgi:hypothetical protein
MTTMTKLAAALLAALALQSACSDRQTRIKLTFPNTDGGACQEQTNIRCVNYLEFTAGDQEHGFSSQCTRVQVSLDTLCDVGKIPDGQELFKLSPGTMLPIRLAGIRVFPATSCAAGECPPKQIFAGETSETGTVGDYIGQTLTIPVTLTMPCGPPEQFFFVPPGSTCTDLCGVGNVVCDNVQGGCLCNGFPSAADLASRQGAIDGGQ